MVAEGKIYPVILAVPESVKELRPKDRVVFLSRHARHALEISAEKSNRSLGELRKDENGAPLPSNNTFWSVTHKTEYVAGVVASVPIGIDIETIRPCSKGLFAKTADDKEWSLVDIQKDPFTSFFRYWTSKEAVVKAAGTGIKDFSKCRISRIIDEQHLLIEYGKKTWLIEHFFFEKHISSIVKYSFQIDWTLL